MTADKKRKRAVRKQAERDGMSYASVVNATPETSTPARPLPRRDIRTYDPPMTPRK